MLKLTNIQKSFDRTVAVNDFSIGLEENRVTGLIGPNGAGKTTLFNIITGFLQQDDGKIFFLGNDISTLDSFNITRRGITRNFQDLRLIKGVSVIDNILLYFQDQPGENIFNLYFKNKTVKETESKNFTEAERLLDFAGIKDKASEKAGNLSYGQQKLLSICCCLAANPKLILLDEPVSGIQPEMIKKISSMLKELIEEQNKTILLIEHDMEFVFNNCSKVIVMDHGKKIAEDTPDKIKKNKEILEAYLS